MTVNLTLHRNTRDRKKRREVSDKLKRSVRSMTSGKNVDGFVLLTWDDETTVSVDWAGGSVPQRALPDFARGVLQSKFSMDDAED